MSDELINQPKNRKHLFQKGQSGNPNGRSKGTGRVSAFQQATKEKLPELIDQVIQRALSGDMTATKLILDKLIPNAKSETYLPKMTFKEDETLNEKVRGIVNKVVEGELPIETLTELAKAYSLAQSAELTRGEPMIVRVIGGLPDDGLGKDLP
jgi:hypothetical protein